jgi:tetratricopeptide (TPR) repeat protein
LKRSTEKALKTLGVPSYKLYALQQQKLYSICAIQIGCIFVWQGKFFHKLLLQVIFKQTPNTMKILQSVLIFSLLFSTNHSFCQNANDYFRSGTEKSKNKDYPGAIADYDKAIAIDSGNANIYFNRGLAKSRLNDYQGAIIDYAKSNSIKEDMDTYYSKALMEIEISDYKSALFDLNKSYEAKKERPTYHFLLGDCKMLLKQYDNALVDLSKAIELKPEYAQAYLLRGVCYMNMNKKMESCADLNKAKELKSDKADKLIEKYCH